MTETTDLSGEAPHSRAKADLSGEAFAHAEAKTDEQPVAEPREIEKKLLALLDDSEGGAAARVQAAKLLLDRIAPRRDEESERREADERNAAIADAKSLLAEFADAKLAGLREAPALDQIRAPEPVDAAFTVVD